MLRVNVRQFLKTNDSTIVEEVNKYNKVKDELDKKCRAFEKKYGVKLIGSFNIDQSASVVAVEGDTSKLPGKWCKKDKDGFNRPRLNNTVLDDYCVHSPKFDDSIKSITVETSDSGNTYFVGTRFFIHHNTVYLSVGKNVKPDFKVWVPISYEEYENKYKEAKSEMVDKENVGNG